MSLVKSMINNPLSAGGLIVREQEPLNVEMPFSTLSGFTTPNESFYVRCHFPIPEIAAANWRLKVEGAVGNATWTGVPLSVLLERAKMKSAAIEVILEGADEGEIANPPRPAGKINFSRSVPLRKAQDDVLLAYEMNGEKLSAAHGFPLRAIVPGWYAMASIKWLRRIIVTSKPFAGYYQSIDYSYWERSNGELPTLTPLAEQQIKAEIARPESGEAVAASTIVKVHGAAWGGSAEIIKVEISADGGKVWNAARLLGEPVQK